MNYLSGEELARHLKVNIRTIRKWQTDKIISFLKVGRLVRFEMDTVQRELSRFTRNAK